MDSKTCIRCKENKIASSFWSKQGKCIECCKKANNENYRKNKSRYNKAALQWAKRNPEKRLAYHRRWKYGVTQEQVNNILALQNNKCAICKDIPKETLALDHDHATNEIRGLLCDPCNVGLGKFKDNPDTLMSAILYLWRPPGKVLNIKSEYTIEDNSK